jgi:phosphoribosylformylglycinamidine synthase
MPGGDASVIRLKGTTKGLSLKTDCNSKYVYLNPYKGGLIAVCESARNVVCTGATPLAITNCLNFGNPYNPEVYYQFSEAVRGIGDACRKLETPVTGGNVSFYNQSRDYAVYPTPVIGMLGLIENLDNLTTSHFKNENDNIYLIGINKGEVGGSEYLDKIHNLIKGDAPDINLDEEINLHKTVLELINQKLINSAHDIAEGGLAVALAECCIMDRNQNIVCDINYDYGFRKDFDLFSESQSRIIVSASSKNEKKILETGKKYNTQVLKIGITRGKDLTINNDIKLDVEKLSDAYYLYLHKIMESK